MNSHELCSAVNRAKKRHQKAEELLNDVLRGADEWDMQLERFSSNGNVDLARLAEDNLISRRIAIVGLEVQLGMFEVEIAELEHRADLLYKQEQA